MMTGKRIVLTGASSGIGAELCRLLSPGNTIVAAARRVEKIPAYPGVTPFRCDISRRENIDALLGAAMEQMGDIDICIANAGFAYYELFDEPDWDHISSIFDTDVLSPVYMLVKLRERKKGAGFTFAVTASAMSHLAMPGYSLYSAAKFALKGFTDAYRFELPAGQHICMIYPIATTTSFFDEAGTSHLPWPRQSAAYVAGRIVRGLAKNKKHIYPSRMYRVMRFMNRFFPVFALYQLIESRKMRRVLAAGDS